MSALLQASQAPAVRESTSPDGQRRRKTPHRDRQCTDNEARSTPVVAQKDTSAVAEAESTDAGMAEAESADVSMAEAEPADVSMAEADSADDKMSPEK